MWLYKKVDLRCWQVGYYTPAGLWASQREFASEDLAAALVHYLNGGDPDDC